MDITRIPSLGDSSVHPCIRCCCFTVGLASGNELPAGFLPQIEKGLLVCWIRRTSAGLNTDWISGKNPIASCYSSYSRLIVAHKAFCCSCRYNVPDKQEAIRIPIKLKRSSSHWDYFWFESSHFSVRPDLFFKSSFFFTPPLVQLGFQQVPTLTKLLFFTPVLVQQYKAKLV